MRLFNKLLQTVSLFVLSGALSLSPSGALAALPVVDSQGVPLPSLAPLIDRVAPAVVNINTFKSQRSTDNSPSTRSNSAGSGVIVDAKQGLILSNHHVIAGADDIRVSLIDGRTFKAFLVGSDPGADLALLKIEADKLTGLLLVDSDQLRVGDFVVAIGNPFGLGQTVTSGIVSGLGRTGLGIENYENFIQTDASINPGNSGGALINLKGELVGINTAIVAPTGSSVGIGFAIPSNMAKTISMHLARNGEVSRGTLGVSIQDLTPALIKAFKVPAGRSGVVVTSVAPKSAAAKAGVISGDIITAINGRGISSVANLRSRLGVLTLNKELQIAYLRNGNERQATAVIAVVKPEPVEEIETGLQFAGAVLKASGDKPGVQVESVVKESSIDKVGIQKGDVILSVNQNMVNSLDDFSRFVKKDNNLLLVQRGMGILYLVLE
ncbi:hypothetical protein BGP75_18855 [Motiliproteus sp. MSK22-1]|nr:hypothetical protein BGP75_18855 [Motiliproteus sp. MSK22-1]